SQGEWVVITLGFCDSPLAISTGTDVAGALHRSCGYEEQSDRRREGAMHDDKTFWVRVASLILTLLVTAACGTVPASVTPAKSDAASHVRVSEAYGKLPLYFEANKGQTDEQVRFLARSSRSTLFLTPSEAVLAFTHRGVSRTVLRMTFIGANPEPSVVGA